MDLQAILDASDSSEDDESGMELNSPPRMRGRGHHASPLRHYQPQTTQTHATPGSKASNHSSNHSTPVRRGTPRANRRPNDHGYDEHRQPTTTQNPTHYPAPSQPPNTQHHHDMEEYANSYAKAMSLSAGAGTAYNDYGRPSPYGGGAGAVDLEQILREDDDDDTGGHGSSGDDDDEDYGRFRTPWTASTPARPFPTTAPVSPMSASPAAHYHHESSSRSYQSSSATGEDWDVLQAILGEDDDEEEDDYESRAADHARMMAVMNGLGRASSSEDTGDHGWSSGLVGPPSSSSRILSSSSPQVDAILQQSDDEEDSGIGAEEESAPSRKPSLVAAAAAAAATTPRTYPPEAPEILPTHTDSFATAVQSAPSGGSGPDDPAAAPPEPTPGSSDWDLEKASRKALQYARTYERKLLRSGHRDIVSPLMVKRRLKPKIELNTKQQQKQEKEREQQQTKPQGSNPNDHKEAGHQQRQAATKAAKEHSLLFQNIQNTPVRFGFSGVVDKKHMKGVSARLLANVPDLPTALAINSRFIAIGTQGGTVMVFDLFETLRQRLTNGGDTPFSVKTAGSVTTVDLSLIHGDVLAAGYTSGFIVLWDTIRGVALRAVIENQNPSPITSVRFLNDLKLVTVDAGGLVNKLSFSRNILWSSYSVESECLLDGTAGQILAMNVLAPFPAVQQQLPNATPAMRKIVLIALSSERSSFAVAVEPTVHVLHRWARPTEEQMSTPSSGPADELESQTHKNKKHVYLPCLSWGWALVSGGGNGKTPILARAWGCSLQLLRASFQEEEPGVLQEIFPWPAFGAHDEFQTAAPVVALEWLSDRSLVYLTVNNQFTVVDTVMMTLLERLDFSGLRLVYAEFSLSRKAEANAEPGSPASAASSSASYCTTFQNSVRSWDNRLLLLCQEELKSVSIVGAKRRISGLEQDGEWLEALALALDHYENTISSQQDRRRDQGRRDLSKHPEYSNHLKSEDEEWIAKLLIRYLNIAVENAPEMTEDLPQEYLQSQLELAQSHFQMLAGVCVEFCVVTKRLDLLFGPIFRRFDSVGFVSVFLDVLEPYILNDKLAYIAPEAMAHFVEHCRTTNGIATVERCLLHMDVTIMDFDSILGLLRANEMYSALFYVFNQGLNDYTSPLEILAETIFDAADTVNTSVASGRRKDGVPRNAFERYGYKAILYLQHCFGGRTFPQDLAIGDEEDGLVASIRTQLLCLLLQEGYAPGPAVRKTSPVIGQRALRYPYAHVLLMVDTKAMLETLSMAMNAPDTDFVPQAGGFESIGGWEVEVGAESRQQQHGRRGSSDQRVPDRQAIISMLLSIIMPEDDEDTRQSTLHQSQPAVNAFLDFLAEYLMKGVVRANKMVTILILNRMASRFESAKDPEDKLHSQKQILQLLTALPRNSYDPEEVLLLVQKSGIHRAALLLHQEGASVWGRHEHEDSPQDQERRAFHFRAAIDCYLEDADEEYRTDVFSYVKKECSGVGDQGTADDDDETTTKPNALRDALTSKLSDLVRLDPILTAELVAELFVDDLDRVIQTLTEENSLFLFFQAIISGNLDRKDQVAGAVLKANLTMEHHHKYLALMAKLHPDDVYDYLQSHDNYRPEACLPLCQKYEIADASCYLLERMGNVSSALQLILQTLESRMMGLKRTIRGMGTEFYNRYTARRKPAFPWKKREFKSSEAFDITEREIGGVKRILIVALDLCERNSGTFSSRTEHGSQLWFNVLDRLINAKGFLRLSNEQPAHAKVMAGVLSELLRLTMQRMVSSVPLPDLVRKVTSDHSGSRLGELREMVDSLLSTYGFELNVFSGAINVFHHDSKEMQKAHRAMRVQGSAVRRIMNIPLNETTNLREKEGKTAESLRDGDILQVGEAGNASVMDSEGVVKNASSRLGEQGLGNALAKLRSRRRHFSVGNKGAQSSLQSSRTVTRTTGLNLMTLREKSYRQGELSPDATYFEDRISGVLGDAEHRGRMMSFMY